MINFSSLRRIMIPEGIVIRVESNGEVLWTKPNPILFKYVSLGDSIGAGQGIRNEERLTKPELYDRWQYGAGRMNSTEIITDSYTDLLRKKLRNVYGDTSVSAVSFARSGDTVADLLEKLSHDIVIKNLKEANLVTICIGANDILGSVGDHIDSYIGSGDLSGLERDVTANLSKLNNDSNSNSYISLLNRLTEINPDAEYVFTTVYNPYKYLYLEEGDNGFFAPLLNTIPNTSSIVGVDISPTIRNALLGTPAVQMLFSRVNILSPWVEEYVGKLDYIIKNKVGRHASSGYNFKVADTKVLYDGVPDRPISAPYHYNDLVNVDYTRGYTVPMMDWARLWDGDSALDFTWYWSSLIVRHFDFSSVSLDINGLATELVNDLINKVIIPTIDPHPRTYGQNMLHRSFANAIGLDSIKEYSITFKANGGSNTMDKQLVYGVDNLTAYTNINPNVFSHPSEGYSFRGWNTKADGSGTAYNDGQLIGLNSDITLYAQWSNIYTVTFRHSRGSETLADTNTGAMECYALWINGVEQSDLGDFTNPARTYELPYGTYIGVIAQTKHGDARSYIEINGVKVAGTSGDARHTFQLTGDTDINFEWNWWIENYIYVQEYWNCYVTMNEWVQPITNLVLDSGVLDKSKLG